MYPSPPRIEMLEPLQMESDIVRLPEWRRWFCSIAFMFSPIYLRLEDVPPLPGTELGSEMSQVSKVNECPPSPSSTWCYAWQRNLWVSISDGYLKFGDGKIQKKFFLTNVRFELANVPTHPQNQNFFYLKLDLSWLMYQPTTPGLKKIFKIWNVCFWITFNFWWSTEQSEWQKSIEMLIRPPKSSKN